MSASGASTAERGPTHTRASPLRSRSHSSWRSPWLERRVQHRDDVAEPGAEPRQRLRGQADLGDEHDRAAPGLERRLDRTQVHLGLARAGDTVQQQAAAVVGPVALGERGQNLVECALLGAGQRGRRCRLAADVDPGRAPRLGRERELDQAASLQAAQRGRAQRRGHGRPAGSELRQQAALAVVEAHLAGQCLTAGVGQLGDQHPLGRDAVCGPGREHQPQRPGDRRAVLARHPPGELRPGRPAEPREAPRRARSAARARARSCRPFRRPPRGCAGGRTGPSAAIPPRRPADLREAGSRTDRGSPACA